MKKLCSLGLLAIASLPVCAQTFPKSVTQSAGTQKSPGVSSPAVPVTLEERRAVLKALFAEIWENQLSHSPEFASSIGDKRYNDQLFDYSVAAYNERIARGREYIFRLGVIDTAGLSDQEILSKDLMVRRLAEEQEEAEYKPWEMPVNQMWGPHIDLPALVPQLSFDTVRDYDDYTARLSKIPTVFQQISANMMTGIDDRRVPPKYILEKVLVQVNAIANQKPEDSPFARPLQKFPAGIGADDQARIKAEVLEAITKQVLPAYVKFARFLTASYIPAGRAEPGLWSIPDGDRYYAFLVRQNTTTDLTPAAIHQMGLDEVKRDEAEMLAVAQKLGFKDLASLRASIASNPKLHAQSTEELLGLYSHYIDQMRPKLPELFGTLPKAPLEIKPVPEYMQQDQTQAYYSQGTPDGKRPGTVYVNLYKFKERALMNVESVSYHEGIPGHHLQIAIAQELTGLPVFRSYLDYTAYTEGWALYSERLGKEIGFYQDPWSDYGRLEADTWRAIRLVVDTGVHSLHWTRQQMLDYFREHSSMDDTNIQAETDRYVAWPGQALGYKIGQLKILELRSKAQAALGPKFDIKEFHDQVVDSGALPMDSLEQRINAWVASQSKTH
ncbi:MAG TPA: DUF885 domain-containing protein [Silvibacterium sp.]|nr:DUF885 domain-containing protein [Silvibacterium sp.]